MKQLLNDYYPAPTPIAVHADEAFQSYCHGLDSKNDRIKSERGVKTLYELVLLLLS